MHTYVFQDHPSLWHQKGVKSFHNRPNIILQTATYHKISEKWCCIEWKITNYQITKRKFVQTS